MNQYRKPTCLDWRIVSLLVAFALLVSACIRGGTPTATMVEPTVPSEPSPAPEPTKVPISHEPIITLSPNITDIQAGDKITILLSFDPPVGVVEAKWEFVVGNGMIVPPEGGDAIVFTASKDEGPIILKVSGATTDGGSFEKKFAFNVILPPPCPFTGANIPEPTLSHSSLLGTFTTPEECSIELPIEKPVAADGTASDIPKNVFLWLFVYARNNRFYPQCDDAAKGLCGANYNGAEWSNTFYLGSKTYPNCKERFYLILASVDADGNEFLISEMLKQSKTGYNGFLIGELPSGIEELSNLEVETAGNTKSCP
jgi:hypothetical protein